MRPLPATVAGLLLLAAAGCLTPQGGPPGPDNPQLVLFRTKDLLVQVVVKGAFKDREYDHVQVLLNGAVLVAENRTFLATEKVNVSAFNLTVQVALENDAYRWDAALVVLPNALRVTEIEKGIAGRPDDRGFPFQKILEKVPEASP